MINTLTSLRIFFAMMVFGAHCYVIDSFFNAHIFKEGFVGVSFFFVLSGFIIAYNYQHKLQEGILSRALSNRLPIKGGEISYSFYLIHLFVLLAYAEWQNSADVKIA